MNTYKELDFYALDDLLTEDEIMIRDQVRAFCEERLMPDIARHWEDGTFPNEVIPELGEMGLLGPSIPEEYGGAGLNGVSYGLICQEIERVDSGLRSFT
jgi:glutaryl-CoA dehydrogenase